jgi:drug/metabolite transporter (DMT)-like permease
MFVWALIVGLSFPAVGLMSEGLPPLLLTAIRFAVAALAIGAIIWRAPDRRPSSQGLILYVVMGLCLAGFFGAMFWAAHQITGLSMATLYVSVPLLAYALGRALGVERRAGGLLAILVLGAAGALTLAWVGNSADGGLQVGLAEGAFFLGCVASALYPVLSKWGLKRGWLSDSAALRTFWSLVVGGFLIGLLGLVFEPVQALARVTFFDFLLVAYLGVFSSGVTFWLMQSGTGILTPGAVTAYTYIVPFVSMVILFVAEPDQIGWQWFPGSVTVVLAIALLLRRSRTEPSGQTQAPVTLTGRQPTESRSVL